MITKKNVTGSVGGNHQVSFRISHEQHQEFLVLMEAVPGSDVGNMYREIFARGFKSLKAFYAKQGIIEDDGSSEKKGA